jgi:hypothetical protein
MSTDLPDPLVPPEVDLRNFKFMPLEVMRLRDSDMAAQANGEEFKASVLLWCAAWHQVPAGSLPDDDLVLARFSGAGPAWRKVRAMALRGFVKCSDGRLYHPTVCEKAADSWESKQAQRKRTQAATDARGASRKAPDDQRNVQRDVERNVQRDDQRNVQRDGQRDTQRNVHQGNREGEGIEREEGAGSGLARPPAPACEASPDAEPECPDAEPTPAGLAYRAIGAEGIADANPGHPGLQRLLDDGVTLAELVSVAAELVAKGKPRFALLLSTVEGRRADAAAARLAASAPAAPAADDWLTVRSVNAKAAAVGLEPWDECVPFPSYSARIRAAIDGAKPS